MKQAFDLLARNGLTSYRRIESSIMHDWSIGKIYNFNEQLRENIDFHPKGGTGVANFQFVSNSGLSAQKFADCTEWDCRVRRIDKLARFAVLYGDRVYVNNYFDQYDQAWSTGNEQKIRHHYVGDLEVFLTLKPLLEAGLISLINEPSYHLCQDCISKTYPAMTDVMNQLEDAFKFLVKKYRRNFSQSVVLDETNLHEGSCTLCIDGPDDIIEDGRGFLIYQETPRWVRNRINSMAYLPQSGLLPLSRKDLARSKNVEYKLWPIIEDIFLQQFTSRILKLNANYL